MRTIFSLAERLTYFAAVYYNGDMKRVGSRLKRDKKTNGFVLR